MSLIEADLIAQGVPAWNSWRRSSPGVIPELDRADLSELDLRGADLRSASLFGADLQNANLSAANLENAQLERANLQNANLLRANLRGAVLDAARCENAKCHAANLELARLIAADLRGADFSRANLRHSNLQRTRLYEADLHEADLTSAMLAAAMLGGANLQRADLSYANLERANLFETSLQRANLAHATLSRTKIEHSNLRDASLAGADMTGVRLWDADLRGADLSRTNFAKVEFENVLLHGAHLHETIFADVDLSQVKGLDECYHRGPSAIDHRTLERSGSLPLPFLHGVGLPELLIEYLPAITAQPMQFYSCFISYSAKDQEFADRLHADLQAKGVRCWFAPHDMPIGAKIWDAIDEAIRMRDRVLLILSRHSIGSEWVEDEVAKAFSEERARGQLVLFPVRLDDTVMETSEPWVTKLLSQRNIGDFSSWADPKRYRDSLTKLVRDLRLQELGS